jgi:class 3 adenylate cyclase
MPDSARSLRIRIGIEPGPIVAGAIGKREFIYDPWGGYSLARSVHSAES